MVSKSLTNVLDLATNSVLGLLLIGIVALATLSVVSLTPQTYESTISQSPDTVAQDQNILGVQDQLPSSGDTTLYKEIYLDGTNYEVKGFKGPEGYVAKVTADAVTQAEPLEDMLIKVANIGATSKEYLVTFNTDQILANNFSFYSIVNGQRIQITDFDGESKFIPFSLIPNSNVNIGFLVEPANDITSGPIEFEIMVIEL